MAIKELLEENAALRADIAKMKADIAKRRAEIAELEAALKELVDVLYHDGEHNPEQDPGVRDVCMICRRMAKAEEVLRGH